jgi:prevent-host-death family protein
MDPAGPRPVTVNELRSNLSETINRAAYGSEPVVITRRRRKIAAFISLEDLIFLERMKKRRAAARAEKEPTDPDQVHAWVIRRSEAEDLFD